MGAVDTLGRVAVSDPAEPAAPMWGSDAMAAFLRTTGVPYFVFNPGASYRGLHDSLVNDLGAHDPAMLMCLHEEHAVAIAHGWAKVTGTPLAVGLHANVGLMHATMAIYNAWCDRVPMLLIGANGPLDASVRRPWIDWLHTTADQAALVRPYVKWDDQPASAPATLQSLARAWDVIRTAPHAPALVVLDVAVQETRLDEPVALPAVSPTPAATPVASPATVDDVVARLLRATAPVILAGRIGRERAAWDARVRLAEATGARVVTDLRAGAGFPTAHPAHVAGPGFFLSPAARTIVADADLVVALEWIDVAGTLEQAPATGPREIVDVNLGDTLLDSWVKSGFGRVEATVTVPVDADVFVGQLVDRLPATGVSEPVAPQPVAAADSATDANDGDATITLARLAGELRRAIGDTPTTLARLPLGWDGDAWPFADALDFLGYDGAAGVGSGPGMLVGAALALRDTAPGRLPIGILGDGDFLMGVQALWTATHERIPLLAVVANNRAYYNDVINQEKVEHTRGRDTSRSLVGQQIDDPAPDLAGLARAQGLRGIGPITRPDDLPGAIRDALAAVHTGVPTVLDVIVEPGYTPAMSAGISGH